MKNFLLIPLFAGLFFLGSCDSTSVPSDDSDNDSTATQQIGYLEIEFRVPSTILPPYRVLRADLSIAKDAGSLYKGDFLQMANVYNSQSTYTFNLAPGTYYYQAGIVCLASNDSCTAANFPGHYGLKWAIGTAQVKLKETTHIVPQFTK